MKKILAMLLSLTMLFGMFGTEFTFAAKKAKELTTKDGFVEVEAEDLPYDEGYLEVRQDKMFSEGVALGVIDEDKTEPAADDEAHLDISFIADKAGTYTVWMLHTAEIENMSGQSIFLSTGGGYASFRLAAKPDVPAWIKLATVSAAADGDKVEVKIRRRQRYGIAFDKFVITNDASYTPAAGGVGEGSGGVVSKGEFPEMKLYKKTNVYHIEAEKAAINSDDAMDQDDEDASGKGLVFLSNDNPQPAQTEGGVLEFSFTAPEDGSYSLWARVRPTTPNKGMWYAVNDEPFTDVLLGGAANEFHWVGIVSIDAKKGENVKYKVSHKTGWFAIDCFAIGKDSDDVYTPDDDMFGLDDAPVGKKPNKLVKSKGLYPFEYESGADISKMSGGVALFLNLANAYAKNMFTTIDPANPAVVATTVNDRTLVPVRFIAESFGAEVGWNADTRTATVKLGDKDISIELDKAEMIVNGEVVTLDVTAQIMHDRTMLPLRAVSENLDKNVFWDNRGLILITDKATTIDASADAELIDNMIAALKAGGIAGGNYSANPYFTQSVFDTAANQKKFTYTVANTQAGSMAANSLYYLTLAAKFDPNAAASNGTLAKDAALVLLRSLLEGGNEPTCSNGPFWSHSVVSAALTLIKNTPVIYSELTADEIARMDLLQKCLAITGNWGYNDANDYATGVDLKGNFGKEWNPNHRHSYLPTVLMAALYFGADELNEIFTSFDYDEYMAELKKYGFTNIIATWSVAGKDLMENGGDAVLVGQQGINNQQAGDAAGTGKGVKIPFIYKGMGLDNLAGIYEKLLEATYTGAVVNGFGADCYIVTGANSPYLGYDGMMYEFAAGDGYGIRSKAGYCYDSFLVIMPVLANLKMMGVWDSQSEAQKRLDAIMYVGHNDMIFKLEQGYQGYSNGSAGGVEYEASHTGAGYAISKDLWVNFHLMENKDITIASKPGLSAEPYNGITDAPEGAYVSVQSLGETFAPESYYDLGKAYTGKVTAEFDLVFGPQADEAFNGVVMFDEQGSTDRIWSNTNVLIQCTGGKINIRDGSKYVFSEFEFGPNFRFHFKVVMDASKKTYSVYMTPTWPNKGEEKLVADNFAFREGAVSINNIGDLIVATEVGVDGNFWVENLTISE